MNISKNKNIRFFRMSQGSFNLKIRFLGQKVCPVARVQTDGQTERQTDTQTHRHTHTHGSDYCGHPFRVSNYHQGSAQ